MKEIKTIILALASVLPTAIFAQVTDTTISTSRSMSTRPDDARDAFPYIWIIIGVVVTVSVAGGLIAASRRKKVTTSSTTTTSYKTGMNNPPRP